ncbi:MAG: hypothetical protein M3Y22_01445, partial [Pseudomonadota bacterium]|nr:hypothetical protein [Pseudomonadota bacterium]
MTASKSALMGAAIAAVAAGTLAASSAAAASYVVCNRYDECWRVHEKYTFYPADERVVYHDDAWYAQHQHDAHWRWLADPTND